MHVNVLGMAVRIVEMFVYVLTPALGFTILGNKYLYMGGCMFTVYQSFYRHNTYIIELFVYKELFVIQFFPHSGFCMGLQFQNLG